MRSLASTLPVRGASAAAEIVFHSEASAADWAESTVQNPKLIGRSSQSSIPPHWKAAIDYARTVILAILVVADEETDEPARFESFTQHCVADVAGTTYQQKLHPYDLVSAKEMPETLAHFQRLVYSAAAKDIARLKLESWKRRSCGLHAIGSSSQRPGDGIMTSDMVGSTRSVRPREATEPTAAGLALEREARLQKFRQQHGVSIAAICRAANVYKTDMKRWRHGKLSQDSVMAKRIENVLSGITRLPSSARERE
jgi:hypothetical protein